MAHNSERHESALKYLAGSATVIGFSSFGALVSGGFRFDEISNQEEKITDFFSEGLGWEDVSIGFGVLGVVSLFVFLYNARVANREMENLREDISNQ